MAFEQPEELGSAVELARPEQRTKPPGSFASELLNGTIHGQLGVEEYAEDLEIVPVGLALVKNVHALLGRLEVTWLAAPHS